MKNRIFCASIFLIAVMLLTAVLIPKWHYNIRTVVDGKIYRSGMLPPNLLQQVITKDHIKSIINLRNAHPKMQWWQKEKAIAAANHLSFYNLAIPAHDLPTPQQLKILTTTLTQAPTPLLIHCKHGSDRSGLASAIALLTITHTENSKIIAQQVSWRYFAFAPTSVGKLVLKSYYDWAKQNGQRINQKTFNKWLYSKNPFALN